LVTPSNVSIGRSLTRRGASKAGSGSAPLLHGGRPHV
jgi:hypothetical protein